MVNYSYDEAGNRISEETAGSYVNSTFDADNRLLSRGNVNYSYDANGNMINKSENGEVVEEYEYDYHNRLSKHANLTSGTNITYKYDPDEKRINTSYDNSGTDESWTVLYYYSGDAVLFEYDLSGGVMARYTHGPEIDEPLVMNRSGERYYYHRDALGSVKFLTDDNCSVAAEYEYGAWGEIRWETGNVTNPYRFTSRERDNSTGLYYYRARRSSSKGVIS